MIDSKCEYIIMALGFYMLFISLIRELFYVQVNNIMKEFFKSQIIYEYLSLLMLNLNKRE